MLCLTLWNLEKLAMLLGFREWQIGRENKGA
jgi:hypothetical protein